MDAATEIRLQGKALHSGASAAVRFSARPNPTGPVSEAGPQLFLPGAESGHPLRRPASGELRALRTTEWNLGPSRWRTPEHLLAALLFFRESSLTVHLESEETPLLDGSAQPFRDALAELFPSASQAPAWEEYPSRLRWSDAWEGGWLRAEPASRFQVRTTVSRGEVEETYVLENPAQAFAEVLPARTFIFWEDWVQAREKGWLQGADAGSGLLLAESRDEFNRVRQGGEGSFSNAGFPHLNGDRSRGPFECARHKVLDLLGDLAVLGLRLPALSIEVRNGGHTAHHRLITALRHERRGET